MRIHSKFRDYYDSCLGYGIDPNCHYVRHTEEFQNKHKAQKNLKHGKWENVEYKVVQDCPRIAEYFDMFPRYSRGWRGEGDRIEAIRSHLILFCGATYVYLEFEIRPTKSTGINKFHKAFSVNDVDVLIRKYGTKDAKARWSGKESKSQSRYRGKRGDKYYTYSAVDQADVKWLFTNWQGVKHQDILDVHYKTTVPVMKVEGEKLIYNPCLKDLEFFKVVDAFQAFQELSMFISGVLGGQSPKMIEISDEVRIAKHGFDKMSFRKEKETK